MSECSLVTDLRIDVIFHTQSLPDPVDKLGFAWEALFCQVLNEREAESKLSGYECREAFPSDGDICVGQRSSGLDYIPTHQQYMKEPLILQINSTNDTFGTDNARFSYFNILQYWNVCYSQ